MTPWVLCAILYALGGIIVFEDMRADDRREMFLGSTERFYWGTYALCVGLWPLLVALVLTTVIIDKIKERLS